MLHMWVHAILCMMQLNRHKRYINRKKTYTIGECVAKLGRLFEMNFKLRALSVQDLIKTVPFQSCEYFGKEHVLYYHVGWSIDGPRKFQAIRHTYQYEQWANLIVEVLHSPLHTYEVRIDDAHILLWSVSMWDSAYGGYCLGVDPIIFCALLCHIIVQHSQLLKLLNLNLLDWTVFPLETLLRQETFVVTPMEAWLGVARFEFSFKPTLAYL